MKYNFITKNAQKLRTNALRFWVSLLGVSAVAAGSVSAAVSVDSVVTTGLNEPYAVATLPDGTSYLTDSANHRVLRIDNGATSGALLAGTIGVPGTNEGYADLAQFNRPQGIVIARGGLVVADSENHTIRFITFGGVVSTLAGAPGVYGATDGAAADARFRYPSGLATDSAGNIYVADTVNNAIRKIDTNNIVTTLYKTPSFVNPTNMFQPSGVAVGDNGEVWIADTRRQCIRRIGTNGVVTIVAGGYNVNGTTDSLIATNARFSSPRGLLWVRSSIGMGSLLVSDSGNQTIRRVYWYSNYNNYAVETFAGVTGTAGADNGPALSATFNSPVGLSSDEFNGGFLVADKGNNQVRRINAGVVQNPVPEPAIGWVDFVLSGGIYITQLRPIISAVFNNDVVIAIRGEFGTQIYYTIGDTPPNPLEDTIPTPAVGVGNTPPPYRDFQPADTAPPSLTPPQPDVTIKAVGTQSGRRSSAVVSARVQFQVGNPSIIGDNAASFEIQNVTTDAQMWYTWDGSEPTNDLLANTNAIGPIFSGDTISFNIGNSNRTFKIRAFRNGYRQSDVITKIFTPDDFVANSISLGFAAGEGSSDYIAAAGQRFYLPVTLSLLPAQKIYSFQFNVVTTNLTGPAIDSSVVGFESMLEKPDPENPGVFVEIPPAMAALGGGFDSLLITNPAINLLGVGWIERYLGTNLYNTLVQDLVTFSQAHDTLFRSSDGKVILGGYSFVVPTNAPQDSTYQVALGRASATSDGVAQDVFIRIPTNGAPAQGAINGIKTVTVGSRLYLVGDPAPFRWFNAGDFGDNNLLNNDVLQTFQSAVYMANTPPPGSDFFDVMDSSDGSVSDLFNGNIDSIQRGDGQLNVDDVYVTFRRSLDPSLKWFARYWSNGALQVIEVPNGAPNALPDARKSKPTKSLMTGTPSVVVSADDIIGTAGSTVQVPIRVHITGGLPLRIAMLGVTVEALDGAPHIAQAVTFTAGGLGAPTMTSSRAVDQFGATWLDSTAAGISGDGVLGTLNVTIPAGAGPSAAYRVHFNHFSGSENGLALFRKNVYDGLVTLANRSSSTWGDGISDAWRLRYFGALSNALSAATADPDRDGVNNLGEFRAGSNPLDGASRLHLNSGLVGAGIRLGFPTGSGRTYVIECTSDLGGTWTPIWTNSGDGGIREYTNTPPAGARRFYRIRVQ